ncbi:hypothetical protein CPC08DRAFT_692332 [Agrocybe pediades]|nr:hypothetical protein CPC08DRAFT_692332 [Agrocybe pediades]
MTKPTLVQTLLNQPSQTYVNVLETKPKQEYYSTKQEMLRIAASVQAEKESERQRELAAKTRATVTKKAEPREVVAASVKKQAETTVKLYPISTLAPTRYPSQRNPSEDDEESDPEVFFTPNTSPRTSMASSVATITFPSSRRLSRRSLSNVSVESYQPMQLAAGDSSSTASKPMSAGPQAPVPSTRTPSTSTSASTRARHALSSSSSISSTSLEGHSIFSDFIDSNESTLLTSPYQSDSGERLANTKSSSKTSRTAAPKTVDSKPRSGKNTESSTATTHTSNAQKKSSSTNTNGSTPSAKSTTTDERSLLTSTSSKRVPPPSKSQHVATGSRADAPSKVSNDSSTTSKGKGKEMQAEKSSVNGSASVASTSDKGSSKSSRQPHTFSAFAPLPTSPPPTRPPTTQTANGGAHSKATSTTSNMSGASQIASAPKTDPPVKVQRPNPPPNPATQRKKPNHPRPPPSGMIGMDAVIEEDEEGPFTPRMQSMPLEAGQHDVFSEDKAIRSLRHTSTKDKKHRSTSSVDSSSTLSKSSTSATPTRQPKTLKSEVDALVYNSTGDRPSNATQGYTSLVLPRAPPPTGAKSKGLGKGDGSLSADGKIDLTKSGVAQTTMATVEVVRGLGSKGGGGLLGGLLGLGRRRSVSEPRSRWHAQGPAPLPVGSNSTTGQGPAHKPKSIDGTPLGFTSYRSPPNYVPSGSVLVQVWGVGVDGVDGRLVGVRFGGNPEGWRDAEHEMEEYENGEETERELETEDEMMKSNQGHDSADAHDPTRKGPFAALGRTLSMRLSRNGSVKQKAGQDVGGGSHKRSASAAGTPSKTRQSEEQSRQAGSTTQRPGVSPNGQSPERPKRSLSFSLKRNDTSASHATSTTASGASSSSPKKNRKEKRSHTVKHMMADVGYIPGRSFVGRVLECGWDVRDEVAKKGDWVMGLLDVRKAGALAEFIVVDRRRIQRVPQPENARDVGVKDTGLSLEELALLPLCGLPAYRAVRTFVYAFSSAKDKGTPSSASRSGFDFGNGNGSVSARSVSDYDVGPHRRRALVLRGHDGAGAMAVQMLVRRGWRVSVHVPFSSVPMNATQEVGDRFMNATEDRARRWGADEVIFDDGEGGGGIDDGRGAAVRVLDSLREDGDIFDAVLDTIGGKEVREAAERLLRSTGIDDGQGGHHNKRREPGQFTTLVGDVPERAIPTAGDNFRAGLRSLRIGNDGNGHAAVEDSIDTKAKVGYAWVSVAQDVDWEGDDVGETLGIVLRQALEGGVRPVVDEMDFTGPEPIKMTRTVPFDDTPYVFVDNGPLRDGGTVVVRVAA